MGEIRDAVDTMTDIKAELGSYGVFSTKRSISAGAMEGTANFPVLLDDSCSLDDGMVICRACEKKYASFLLTVLSMDPFLEVEKGKTASAADYVSKFHQNTRVKPDVRGLGVDLTAFVKESLDEVNKEYEALESHAYKAAYAIYEGVSASVPQDKNIRLNYTIEEIVSESTLNDKFAIRNPLMEAKGGKGGSGGRGGGSAPITVKTDNQFAITNNITMPEQTGLAQGQQSVKTAPNVRTRGIQWKPLTDNDCKKANDLVPTLLHVRVYPVDKETREELTPIDFLMGVKATLHPIPLSEITRMVVTGMRNENMKFNFIRWRTGEIKFFKDFLFAIDTLKADAKDSGKDVTGWRPALKRRRRLSKIPFRLSKNSLMPNATLVVTQSGVDYIKDMYGFNMSEEMTIDHLMDVYFLLGYVVVNTVTQRATFKFDGIESTDTYTFDSLRRENQNDDKAFKNLMKVLGRSM